MIANTANGTARSDVYLPQRAQRDSTSDSSTGGSSCNVFDDDEHVLMTGKPHALLTTKPQPTDQLYQHQDLVPPAPRLKGTIEYLDLDLDMPSRASSSKTARGGRPVKSPPPKMPDLPGQSMSNAGTVYKTVDFVKTKALTDISVTRTEMRKSK
ncbi:PREDICTED: uncharacterized protein LOC106811032 [Priapulus caudatus]|uniref:Uncharacterized protein LOC106811032 n=1 Tax=Priapulus caudatus TaxID=37621 RepID=A0ABM1ECW5_PRICU|nr:PREDICTED: uncharacterized protein LOC106811032 [Priapulus caudatus]